MTEISKHPKLPIYPDDKVNAVKDVVDVARLVGIVRPEERLVESHLQTILANREKNIVHPEIREKMGIAVYGASGSGKSYMTRKLLRGLPGLGVPTPGYRPLVSLRLQGPVKLQSAGFQVARALGYPAERNNEKHDYWVDVGSMAPELGTKMLGLDEVQDAFITSNRITAANIVSMFKGLMIAEAHPICLLLTGTLALKPYFETNDPQSPRRLYHVTLPSIGFPADAKAVAAHISQYCKKVGLENDLSGKDYERLMRTAAYQFGRTFSRAFDGMEEALLAGSKSLQLVHLAHAYQRDRGVPPHKNPFVASDYLRLDLFRTEDLPDKEPQAHKSVPREEGPY